MQVARGWAPRIPFFYGWVVVVVAGSSLFVRNTAGSLTFSVFLYAMSQDLGWSRALLAGAASIGGLVASGLSPLAGWGVDRYGVRPVLLASVLLLGLATLSLAWTSLPLTFYLGYAVIRALFGGPIQIGATVAVARWFIVHRGRAMSALMLFSALGTGVFPLLAQGFISLWGWREAWFLLGLVVWAVALGPIALFLLNRPEDVGLQPDGVRPSPSPDPGGSGAPGSREVQWSFREAVRTPTLWALALAGGLVFLIQAGVNTHIGAYLQDRGIPPALSAFTLTLHALFSGGSMALLGVLTERFSVRSLYILTALLMALCAGALLWVDTAWKGMLVMGAFGVAIGGILTLPPLAYANYYGRRSLGSIRGVTEPFVTTGQAVGALLSGLLYDRFGTYEGAFLVFTGAGVLAVLLTALARPPRREEVLPPSSPA